MNRLHSFATSAVLATAALSLPSRASADQINWSGLSSSGLNWSDVANWDPSMPGSHDVAYFGNLTGTNIAGAVNNVVDANTALGSVWYTAQAQSGSILFDTTLIPPGITLTLGGLGSSFPALAVGDVPGQPPLASGSATNYSTIKGAGSLVLNDSGSLLSVGMRNRATLDLSGLSSVTANLSQLWVAASPDNSFNSGVTGVLLLGQTNHITTTPNPNVPGILLGALTNGSGTATVLLGYTNTFNTDALVVGGRRAGFGTALQFGLAASNTTPLSTFTLRGSDGISAAAVFSIGDLSAEPGGFNAIPFSSASSSSANFSGGNVDILVDSLYVGRSTPATNINNTTTGTGTLIVENGTVTATKIFMSYKMPSANNTAGNGTMILRSNAVMNVIKDFSFCFRTNGSAFLNAPILVVSNSAVLNIGGNLTYSNVGGGSAGAITLGGSGAINMTSGGYVLTPILSGVGSITGSGNIIVTNGLSINTDSSVGTLNLANNLTLANPFRLTFNLGADTTVGGGVNDYLNVANNITFNNNPLNITFGAPLAVGTYKLIGYGGTQSGSVTWVNPTRSSIGLVQGNGQVAITVTNFTPATLTWKGTNNTTGAWDGTTTNWNNNTDRFFTMDNVIFDDTGAATNVSITSTTNFPENITFNNSVNKYTLSQSSGGAIGGFAALNKNGTGTLAMGGGGLNNYFTGPVNLNHGTLQIASFNTGVLGINDSVNPINIAIGAMLDLNGNSIGTGGTYGRAVNFAGSGVGGIGAIVHNGISSSPPFTTRNVALTGDATIGCTTAGLRLSIIGMTTPYLFTFDLAGHTLTTTGAGNVALGAFTMTNAGSINVNSTTFTLGPSSAGPGIILDGPGTINVGNKTLAFGSTSGAFTTGYVAKAISVTSGAISIPTQNASPVPLMSPISIADGGSLSITNLQPLVASGVISGNGSVTKYASLSGTSSNLILSAVNTFTGPLEVTAGQLSLVGGGSLACSLVLVDQPAVFDVTGLAAGYTVPNNQNLTVNGIERGSLTVGNGGTCSGFGTNGANMTVAAGGSIMPGSSLVQGTLAISNNLTFNGGTATFKLNSTTTPGSGVNDLITVGGDLSFTGPTTIHIEPVATLITAPYTLFTYTGTLSGIGNVTLTSDTRYTFTLDSTSIPGSVLVTISGTGGNLVWQGGAVNAPNAWDVVTTSNWLNGASLDRFFQGDSVTFDDTASTTLVTMAAQVKPASITMNPSGTYVFNGNGSLLAGTLAANSGSVVIANTNNNLFNGQGIQFNGGSVTFNQPNTASLTAKLSGSAGSLTKAGANTLTFTSPDSSTMLAAVNIAGGTLRPTTANALGLGTVTVAPAATLDLNGQPANAANVHASGVGADGLGAINNRGFAQTNAIISLTLDGNTVLGAASNRWDVAPMDTNGTPGTLQGNNYSVTKTGAADIWLRQLSDTGLGDIDVTAGRLIFSGSGTKLGNNSSTITVRTNAVLGFAFGVQDAGKSTLIAPGGQLYSAGSSNEFDGAMVLSNGLVKLEPNAQLTLGGNLSGPAILNVQGVLVGNFGTLTLSGTNTYTGSTLVNDGELDFGSSNSIPAGTNIVLASRVAFNSSGHPVVGLLSNVVSPTSVQLLMQTVGSAGAAQATLQANGGTWGGPIKITGNDAHCVANFNSGFEGLIVAGTVDGTGFIGNSTGNGGVKIGGDSLLVSDVSLGGVGVRFNNPLQFSGTFSCVNSGLGGQPGMSKLVLAASGNSWTNMFWNRGVIQFGADNALPLCPITIGTLAAGADHRVIVDLNGHTGTLANWTETFLGNDTVWFGNSSTNADAVLTYAGTGTNSWTAYIIDAFDINAAIQKTTSLRVTTGYLKLMPFPFGDPDPNSGGAFPSGPPPYPFGMTYTGPTTVTGGTLEVNKYLGLSPVTVSGTGTLRGNGPIGGTLNVASGGAVAPGTNTIGTLTVSNSVTFNSGSKAVFRVNLTNNTDQLLVQNALTYGGTLIITNLIASKPFTNGTIVKLFDAATYVAGPVAVQPNSPAPGLTWDTSSLAVDGTLRVTTTTAPTLANAARLSDGNITFQINGAPGQGYSVRGSTNIALPLTNWTILQSGTITATPYVFTDLNATNYPLRFYGVSSP
jgi:autotransporter-associated beta strand protein